ncbi:olfactory receptor 52N2-like [Xenopus laevis]|uniref:Olfactory receptor n=1 Tax=Xenopus laevis TaxID=8355 RepID=A0A8J1MC73_XENLA|nr:olfactory receptor 52N2-like [Xenopus laevis]
MEFPNNSQLLNRNMFALVGIPGLESDHIWISIPLSIMYLTAILGNGVILFLIASEEQLHNPMCYFLSVLSLTDIFLSNSIAPKMLSIFWVNHKEIDFVSCLTQMFFVHFLSTLESGILLAMAFDRYVAICNPLHYTSILTNILIQKIVGALIIRGTIIVTPLTIMASRLPYCGTHHISHSYCDHMSVVMLACTSTTINSAYGLTVVLLVVVFDAAFIGLSYSMILKTVMGLSTRTANKKALRTCTSHFCVILLFYMLGLFSIITHRIGHIVPSIHVTFSNLYLLFPPMLNPLVYGAKTKEIRNAAFRLFSLISMERTVNF